MIPPALVKRALREINRQLGLATGGVEPFRGKIFTSASEVLDLFRNSLLPGLCEQLLGNSRGVGNGHDDEKTNSNSVVMNAEAFKQQLSSAQPALRFPGDLWFVYSIQLIQSLHELSLSFTPRYLDSVFLF